MSNDIQKADQIAHRFYSKLCLVVSNARTTAESTSQGKVDKWFNLETPDSDIFKDHLRLYRAVSSSPSLPPFELQVLLSVPELTNNQVLVYLAPDSSRVRIDPTPQHILLENWLLTFSPTYTQPQHYVEPGDVAPSTIYKHGIPLFRSLFSLLRILPSWKLFRKLRRRMSTPYRNGNLSIQLRINAVDDRPTDILDFDVPPAQNTPPLPYETHTFPSIPHPMGTLSLAAKYLTTPNFQLDELESLLSSRFLSLDEGPDFTPTLAKNQQRDSMSGLPGSLPLRTSLPKSPPSSIAGQFVLPAPSSRTNSLPGSQSPRTAALPLSRTSTNMATAGSTSALSVTSSRPEGSTAWSKEDGIPLSGIAARIRRESTSTTGRSSLDLPSAPGPLPIRRPNINPVHPFKSSTLSSGSPSIHSPSPSLRQPSPLTSGAALPGLPSRPTQTSPNSSRVPPSPIGVNRPSPPFASSSLGDRRSLTSADGEETSPRFPRQRYSSSFGHRYATSGGATSDGSPGSTAGVDRKDGERSAGGGAGGAGTPAFLGATTDDDEISIFVQEIDARKPLASVAARQPLSAPADAPSGRMGGAFTSSPPGASGRRDGVPAPFGSHASRPGSNSSVPGSAVAGGADMGLGLVAGREQQRRSLDGTSASNGESKRSSSSMGPMLTREAEVDEKLRHMHEVFLASLEGLGSGRRDGASGGSGSGSGVVRGSDDDSAGSSRACTPDGGGGVGGGAVLGGGLPSGLGRERRSGSLRSGTSVGAIEPPRSSGRQAGLSSRPDVEGDSPRRRTYGERSSGCVA